MNKLEEAINLKKSLIDIDEKILNIIYNMLFDVEELQNEYSSFEELKEDYIIGENLLEGEFSINYSFGNMSTRLLSSIDERFQKEGFVLYTISDCEVRSNMNGLILYFKKKED